MRACQGSLRGAAAMPPRIAALCVRIEAHVGPAAIERLVATLDVLAGQLAALPDGDAAPAAGLGETDPT